MTEVIDLTNASDSESEHESESEGGPLSSSEAAEVDVPPALENAARTQLRIAIDTVPEDRLRKIVKELVDSVPAFEAAMLQKLVATTQHTKRGAVEVEVAPRWEVCANCDEQYDVGTRRYHGECIYHPGELEVEEESFVDWDEDCHGPMDTPQNRRQWPENFTWSCCTENGISEGCEETKHVPGGHRKKRARY